MTEVDYSSTESLPRPADANLMPPLPPQPKSLRETGLERPLVVELIAKLMFVGGKTHLSVGLARAAAHAGYRTYFTTAADLAARCHRAAPPRHPDDGRHGNGPWHGPWQHVGYGTRLNGGDGSQQYA